MTKEELDIRNHKIIENIGLAKAFNDLCQYICEEDLREWQGAEADYYDIDLYED